MPKSGFDYYILYIPIFMWPSNKSLSLKVLLSKFFKKTDLNLLNTPTINTKRAYGTDWT